jgi:hypothetical protein
MKTISINRIIFTFLLISLVCSCKKDKTNEPIPINQSELITKVQLVFRDSITNSIVQIATFSDIDGPGGIVATIDSILLPSSKTYYMDILVLDETKSPVDTISNEVLDEGDVHLFVFSPNPSANFIETTILDMDINFKPIGLLSILHTTNGGLGTYTVELRHFDSEAAKAANTAFDTDVSITFGVRLQ